MATPSQALKGLTRKRMMNTQSSLLIGSHLLKPINIGLTECACFGANSRVMATAPSPLRSTGLPGFYKEVSLIGLDNKVLSERSSGIDSLLSVGAPPEAKAINGTGRGCFPNGDIGCSTKPFVAPQGDLLIGEGYSDYGFKGAGSLVHSKSEITVTVHKPSKVGKVSSNPIRGISPWMLSLPYHRVSVLVTTDHVVTSSKGYFQYNTTRECFREGVETRRVSPNNNPVLERPARKGRYSPILVERPAKYPGKNAAGHDNAIYHRDSMALAWRVKPMTQNFDDIDTLSHQTAIQTIYGVVEVRDDHGVWAKGA